MSADPRKRALELLRVLHSEIAGEWPLHEAFTDLDDHPEQDDSAGFNYNIGYVVGLCEAAGLDVGELCAEIEKPGVLACAQCGRPFLLDAQEVTTHVFEDGEPDYDTNADHVAYGEEGDL